ncbi:MAG: hypothetical protein D3906_17095, partial [Candidatus Electrothrix sp. AUS1_2]|nr:hypothetical protein [Candidatus Electrothrix sp. AUS1_2]
FGFVVQPAKPAEPLRCPAGKRYFRIWNDGRVQGCMPYDKLSNMGNIKERNLVINKEPALCPGMNQCDCGWALSLHSDTGQLSWWKKQFFRLQNKLETKGWCG